MTPSQRMLRWLRNEPVEVPAVMPRVAGGTAPSLSAAKLEELVPVLQDTRVGKSVVLAAIQRSADVLESAAEAAAAAAAKMNFQFDDLLNVGGTGFVDGVLQRSFRNSKAKADPATLREALSTWAGKRSGDLPMPPVLKASDDRAAQMAALDKYLDELGAYLDQHALDIPPDDPIPGTPSAWAKGLSSTSGPAGARLVLYLGPGYSRKLGRPGGVRRLPGRQTAANWPRLVASVWPPVAPGVDAVAQLHAVLTSPQALANTVRSVLGRRVIDPALRADREAQAIGLLEELVQRYAPDGALTVEAAADIMGRRDMVPEAVIDRALIGLDMIADTAETFGEALFPQLLQVQGIGSFLERVIRGGGYEHGYVFEVFVVARELFQGTNVGQLWMQVWVNGKMGPDIVRVITHEAGGAVHLEARLVQAKSFRDLNQLISATGEVRGQLTSDLRRLAEAGFKITGPNGEVVPIAEVIEFKIDWSRLDKSFPDIEQVLKKAGLDLPDLRSMDPTRSARARQVFYDNYMATQVNELNAWLKSAEFRQAIGVADDDWLPDFGVQVDLVDQVVLDAHPQIFGR